MFWIRSASADRMGFRIALLLLFERDGMPRRHTWGRCETPRRSRRDLGPVRPSGVGQWRTLTYHYGGSFQLGSSDKSIYFLPQPQGLLLFYSQSRDICSRPWRSVLAIQMSSFRNLSMRRM